MENADIRRRVREAMAGASRQAADRRARDDEAASAWATVLERTIVPLSRQLVQALAAEGVRLQVSTPGERVVIGSEHRPDEYVELALEVGSEDAVVVARVNRARAAMIDERVVVRGADAIAALEEERLLALLLDVLRPWLAR